MLTPTFRQTREVIAEWRLRARSRRELTGRACTVNFISRTCYGQRFERLISCVQSAPIRRAILNSAADTQDNRGSLG